MSIIQRLKNLIPPNIRARFTIPNEEGFFGTDYRFPAPGSQTPPDVTLKVWAKTRPLTRIYKFLKKRGEVPSLRDAPKFMDAKNNVEVDQDPEFLRHKEFYETPVNTCPPPRIMNNKVYYHNVKVELGYDIRNWKNIEKNLDKTNSSNQVLEYDEFDIDTRDPIPKKADSMF